MVPGSSRNENRSEIKILPGNRRRVATGFIFATTRGHRDDDNGGNDGNTTGGRADDDVALAVIARFIGAGGESGI
jgi:hypothetical protein